MKSLKTIALVLVLVVIVSLLGVMLSACTENSETLILYNWEDYIDEDVLDEFQAEYEEKYGVSLEVQYVKFDVNETLLTKVLKGKYVPDLMCPSEYAIEQLYTQGMLQPIEKGENAQNNVDSLFAEKLDATFDYLKDEQGNSVRLYDYMVPYMYGTLGIMYNADVLTEEEVTSAGWSILFGDVEDELLQKIKGKVYMKNSERDAYAAAVMYLKEKGDGVTDGKTAQDLINDVSDAMVSAVYDVLSEQANSGVLIGYETDDGKEKMLSGKGAIIDLSWSGDAMYAIYEASETYGVNLGYYAPSIGGNLWFDGWVMHKDAANKRAAQEFLEFVCRPEIAMRNMMYIGYSSAVDPEVLKACPEALEILYDNDYDDEYFEDENVYPQINKDNLSRLGVMKDFGEKRATVSTMWESVKASTGIGNLWIVIVAVVVAVLGLVILAFVGIKARDFKKSKRYIDNETR